MRKTLASLVFLFVFLFLSSNLAVGQDIQLAEKIHVDPAAKLQVTPISFCVTEDGIFLLSDYKTGTIKIFGKNGNFLKFIVALGPDGFGKKEFAKPWYCFYTRDERKFGVIDYGEKRIFIFKRRGKVDFGLINDVVCKSLGYDIKFTNDGKQFVVSGYVTDKKGNPFDLYGVNIRTGQISYLLPSHQKYNLENNAAYILEYYRKQTLPAIGIKAFIDVEGDDLFFVWEGALRVIKINLRSREKTAFGHDTPYFSKPDESKLADSNIKGDFETVVQERKRRAYVRNIFATSRHIFLVYETAKNDKSNASTFRLQRYTPEGKFLCDAIIHGNPDRQMWLDKETYELYTFSKESGNDSSKFSILKYKIKR